MKKHVPVQVDRMRQRHHRRHRWYRLVLMLSCIVVFCTVYALIIPALTMEKTPICGQEEHTHSDDCYRIALRYSDLDCPFTAHEHSDACYGDDGEPVCGKADNVIHIHDNFCYDESGNLICSLPQMEEHRHDESCYKTLGYRCGQKESEGHLHNEDCYTADGTLICEQKEEESHRHTAACKAESRELICEKPEVVFHEHSAACYTNGDTSAMPICGQLQVLRHRHDENCFKNAAEEKTLICMVPEHQHDDVLCYPAADESAEEMYHCGMAAHTHDEDCRNEDGEPVCTVPEHRHEAACLESSATRDAGGETVETAEDIIADADKGDSADDVRSLCFTDENGTEIMVQGSFPKNVVLGACDYDEEELSQLRHQLPLKDEKLLLAWNIALLRDGNIYQPASPVKVTVCSRALSGETEDLCGYVMSSSDTEPITAVTGSEPEALPLPLTVEEEKVSFTTESFPLFYFTVPASTAENGGEVIGEMAEGNVWQELAESGYFEYWEKMAVESEQAKANMKKSSAKAVGNDASPTSAQQIDEPGGENSRDGVNVSKTIEGTDLENVFDITLQVNTTQKIEEVYEEPDMAVVIVLDVSNTMTYYFEGTTTSRYEAAMASAEQFLDKFAAANSLGVSKIGFVAFNTDAHEIFDLRNCTDTAQANALKNTMRGETGKIVTANGYSGSPSRFTNIEAGLKMASDMLNKVNNKNKFIVFLSDGFPTTYIQNGYHGYNPNSPSGTPGQNGVFYDSVTRRYCNYGTSYSDKAAIRAREEAGRIKSAGIEIFSIGVDIGGQTVQRYVDQTKGSQYSYSVVDRTSETYEIGDASSAAAYKDWLKNKIGSGYYYDSTNTAGVESAFRRIFESIQDTVSSGAEANWVAEDPIPMVSGSDGYVEFLGFYDMKSDFHGMEGLSGKHAVGEENTAEFGADENRKNVIRWDLKRSGFTRKTEGSVTTYTYVLKYRVRLKNENIGFAERSEDRKGGIYPTNDPTKLSYQLIESSNGNITVSEPKTIDFPIPSVHGYLVDFNFKKQSNIENKPLPGVSFTLSHDGKACGYCRGNGIDSVKLNDFTASSGDDGAVTFANVPSGHTYTLTETSTPPGYKKNDTTYTVKVAYDKITVTGSDGSEWNGVVINYAGYALPATGGVGTKLFVFGGLSLMAFALISGYILWRRRGRRGA